MNRPIRVMAIACLVLFVALMANINYIQYIDADDLNTMVANNRVRHDEFSRERGPIIVGDRQIALSEPVDDEFEYLRAYRQTNLYANLTGFYSYDHASTDLENSQNSILSGSDPRLFVNRVIDLLSSEQSKGGSVTLTIDPEAQRAAYEGLTKISNNGAAVALDPDTGAVLAMVSVPGWDPNPLASHDFGKADAAYQDLIKDPANPLLDRSREQIYAPGSTFKLVTAAAALQNGYNPDSEINGNFSLSFPGIDYQLVNEFDCGGSTLTIALANSCNVAFGDLALDLGEDKIRAQAEAFGFGDSSYLDGLTVAPSQFTLPGSSGELDEPQLAQSAIGQYNVAATPLQMAMVAAGIANDGVVMNPYIVDTVRSPEFEILERTQPDDYSEAMSSGSAAQLKEMMQAVVTQGTAAGVGLPEGSAAKTGTAQRGAGQNPYAWFVACSPDDEVAIAVIVEDPSNVAQDDITGSGIAGPIAVDIMNAVRNK
ncbi:MAG TPA: penicillin-binding protein 2 [Nocardioidaceae bacterium]|nr:penicillin-binding protein 2 [Nocardioidaceae bacterium]